MSFKKIAMTLALILSTVAAVAQTKTVKGVSTRRRLASLCRERRSPSRVPPEV